MEDILAWHAWLYAGLALLIIELFTPGFVAACIGIGCLVAAPIAGLEFSIEWQLASFASATLISLFGLRPIVLKKFYQSSDKVKTNTESLIGKEALVSDQVGPEAKIGRAKIDGDSFMARSQQGDTIESGVKVKVVAIDSTILIVNKI